MTCCEMLCNVRRRVGLPQRVPIGSHVANAESEKNCDYNHYSSCGENVWAVIVSFCAGYTCSCYLQKMLHFWWKWFEIIVCLHQCFAFLLFSKEAL